MSERKGIATASPGQAGDPESRIRYLEHELAQVRKLEEIGMLAGVLAHDLNNILTPIFGYSTILKRDMDKEHPLAKAVGVIEKSAERAALLVGKLLGCSRQMEPVVIPVGIAEQLESSLDALRGKVAVENCFSEVPPILGDPHQIAVLFRCLFNNAVESMGTQGKLSITVDQVSLDQEFCRHHPPLKPGTHVCIVIADNGRGMSPDFLEKAFDPFISTKPADFCAGIGLTLARSIARKHTGYIKLESCEGKGTIAKVYLPAYQG
ncbi:wide host range VirA protein [Geobacter sp. OR-1]|uniref:sensor histidine kinase n=1 Tax=Geobacter sp. OR-1 TaxID=1266765 RepID=UPI000541B542|nr:ATP-binding protein [Geobacter sp. OR-1]GAM09739.1 wide host range VirA protein [Geobacter sp. OR-1]